VDDDDSDPGYVAPAIEFTEKRVAVVELGDVFMEGPSGIIFRGAPDCEVYTGNHLFTAKIPEEFTGGGGDGGQPTERFSFPVASVVQQNPGNYYHAIAETAAAVAVLRESLLKATPMKLLVPRSRSSLVGQALRLMGIDLERDTIDYVGTNGKLSFERLYVVDWRHEGDDVRHHDSWLPFFPPRFVLSSVIRAIGKAAKSVEDTPDWRVIYIGRSDAGVRRILPSDAPIVEAIRGVVGTDRLVEVTGKSMTLLQQIETFAKAAVIVGPHGAGLTNMLWMPSRGASVIIFPMRPVSDICFAHMAVALGHDYYEVASLHSYYYGDYTLHGDTPSKIAAAVQQVLQEHNLIRPTSKSEL
jgi:hypothetical protein